MKHTCFLLLVAAMLVFSPDASAVCTGHSNATDPVYSNADPAATVDLPNGYDWQFRTTPAGVEISVTFLDDFPGMDAPYLFLFDSEGNLVGDRDIAMQSWDPRTHTAKHLITGFSEGSQISFLVKIAYALHVVFTERFTYTVGDNCKSDDDPDDPVMTTGVCKGSSNRVDDFYTSNDAAAAKQLPKGYDWKIETKESSVEVTFTFKDNFPGMAAPDIFLFNSDGILMGSPIPMHEFANKTAKHYFLDFKEGDQICFLVKLAYELHVLFTKRITYTVGTSCEEDDIDFVENSALYELKTGSRASKLVENGMMYIVRDGVRYNVLGAQVE